MSSLINGDQATYTFSVTPSSDLINSDKLTFTLPSEVSLSTTMSCLPVQNLNAVSCTHTGNTVTLTFTFSTSPLLASTQFKFSISSVTNPPST